MSILRMASAPRLILASGSSARRTMLEACGLAFDVIPAKIDEAGIRDSMISESASVEAADIAVTLATEKALAVSRLHPGAVVIGADQVLALGRRMFSKAQSVAEARQTLEALRGQTHELVSAVALARDNELLWHTIDSADLAVREFSDEFLGNYLTRMGPRLFNAVGCYQIEAMGAQLFDSVEGDYFTILGMPLLPLLAELRRQDLVTP